jgi:alpha-beta hydrolase superfamily lysophospholipase
MQIRPSTQPDNPIYSDRLPADLDRYLKDDEARFADIIPGAEKKIIWHDPHRKQKTPLALVYLHGFSACRQEIRPVCEEVARRLGANLFLTRLTGHGRNGRALAEASLSDWRSDALEALMIGRRMGKKVILVGTSTGGTLATWLADYDRGQSVAACVLLSPNFGVKHVAAGLLFWPGARYWLPLVVGKTRAWEPLNERHARYWTLRYPIAALIPMMQAVEMVRRIDLGKLSIPMQFLYSRKDQIVDAREIEKAFDAIGSKVKKRIIIQESQHSMQHVIAGDILSPSNNERVIDAMTTFLGPYIPNRRSGKLYPRASILDE